MQQTDKSLRGCFAFNVPKVVSLYSLATTLAPSEHATLKGKLLLNFCKPSAFLPQL